MKNFGKNVNTKLRSENLSDKETFSNIIELVDLCNIRTEFLEEKFGFDLSSYDADFFIVIENLLLLHYGDWKTDIICWWIYDRLDDEGKLKPLEVNTHTGEEGEDEGNIEVEKIYVETPNELWELLKKIELK